ncbi:hypothetical protein DXG01_000468 [Tephrocybe rancida]|nr:hypothetical protein DXG01_000468 [Tephrocybe rancida]
MTIPQILSSKAYSWVVDGPMQWLIKGFRAAFCITRRHSRNYSGVQAKVRHATSDNDTLDPTIALMYEITQMSYNSDMLVKVVRILDSRLKDESRNCWPLLKVNPTRFLLPPTHYSSVTPQSLMIIEHILGHDSQNFAHYYHENIDTLRAHMTLQYPNSDKNDEGADVRQKATEIVEHILGEPGVREHCVNTPLLSSESSTQSRRHSEGINNTPGVTASTTDTDTGQHSQNNTTLSFLIDALSDEQHYRRLLNGTSSDEAQILFERCQTLLDSSEITCEHRGQIIALMQRLAGKTESFPSYLFIHGPISLAHEQPVNYGGFGDIYKATLHHETLCLKVLRQGAEPKSFKTFAKEYILWSQFSHPNLLPFYGLHELHSGQVSLVSPWAENGTLQDFLSREIDSNTTIDRILLCLDVAMGGKYLHKLGVVHGDIKSTNILVDRKGRLYLADFGFSSVHGPQIVHWTLESVVASKGGTVRWQAPELHQDMSDPEAEESIVHNTKMSDVFALGCVFYEVPFHAMQRSSTVMLKVIKGQVPLRPMAQDPAWLTHGLNERGWNMMEACWAFNPMARPTMAAIASSLKLERPATFIDPRPPPQWPAGSAIRFRNSQNVGHADRAHSLEDLKAILLRVTGPEV